MNPEMQKLSQRLLPPSGQWISTKEIYERFGNVLDSFGFSGPGSEFMIYTFQENTRIDGDLDLEFAAIDESEEDIYTLLNGLDVDQDSAYFLFLGDLEVKGELYIPCEDPHFQLYVVGDLVVETLSADDGLILGDTKVSGYQFVDDHGDFTIRGLTYAKAIFHTSQANISGKPAPGVLVIGGVGLPFKENIAERFSEIDYPLYQMKIAGKKGEPLLHSKHLVNRDGS